jgi:hypothetical protein
MKASPHRCAPNSVVFIAHQLSTTRASVWVAQLLTYVVFVLAPHAVLPGGHDLLHRPRRRGRDGTRAFGEAMSGMCNDSAARGEGLVVRGW